MINIFISAFIALFSFQAFTFNFQLSGIRKTVINIPITIFETSIKLPNENIDYVPSFDKVILQDKLMVYFNDSLPKYCTSFDVKFYYYNTDDKLFCRDDFCDGVKVNVSALLLHSVSYQEKMFYEIKDNRK